MLRRSTERPRSLQARYAVSDRHESYDLQGIADVSHVAQLFFDMYTPSNWSNLMNEMYREAVQVINGEGQNKTFSQRYNGMPRSPYVPAPHYRLISPLILGNARVLIE